MCSMFRLLTPDSSRNRHTSFSRKQSTAIPTVLREVLLRQWRAELWFFRLTFCFFIYSNWQHCCFNRLSIFQQLCHCCTCWLMVVNRAVLLEMRVRSVKFTVGHPILGCVFLYSARNTAGRCSAIHYLASNSEFTISWCVQVTHTHTHTHTHTYTYFLTTTFFHVVLAGKFVVSAWLQTSCDF